MITRKTRKRNEILEKLAHVGGWVLLWIRRQKGLNLYRWGWVFQSSLFSFNTEKKPGMKLPSKWHNRVIRLIWTKKRLFKKSLDAIPISRSNQKCGPLQFHNSHYFTKQDKITSKFFFKRKFGRVAFSYLFNYHINTLIHFLRKWGLNYQKLY